MQTIRAKRRIAAVAAGIVVGPAETADRVEIVAGRGVRADQEALAVTAGPEAPGLSVPVKTGDRAAKEDATSVRAAGVSMIATATVNAPLRRHRRRRR